MSSASQTLTVTIDAAPDAANPPLLRNLADGVKDLVASTVALSVGDTTAIAASGGVTLSGDKFANTLVGTSGADALHGRGGNDTLRGNAGADVMLGGTGNDRYLVDNAYDAVTEAIRQGTDTVYASVDYTLGIGSEIEFLRASPGSAGLDLTGNEFANQIVGSSSDDVIAGGGGADTLWGREGADIFAFMALSDSTASPGGRDTIMDFSGLMGDLIGLGGIDANHLRPGDQGFKFIGSAGFSGTPGELRSQIFGSATVISGDVNGNKVADFAIKLNGLHEFTGANFIL